MFSIGQKKRLFFTGVFIVILLVFFIKNIGVEASESHTHEEFEISGDASQVIWNIGELAGGKSIDEGILEFDVTGLSQKNEGKRQIFSMVDKAAPSPYDNAGYWLQFRKREKTPQAGNAPGFDLKTQISCEWDEVSKMLGENWIPDHTYHFKLDWDDDEAEITITDKDNSEIKVSGKVNFSWPFLAQKQAVYFGAGPASSAAFPAEPGSKYKNVTLEIENTNDYDDNDGYPKCDEEPPDAEKDKREDEKGTDMGDPMDDLSDPYDTCGCVSFDGKTAPPCEDPESGDQKIDLASSPFSISIDWKRAMIKLKPKWTLNDVAEELFNKEKNDEPSPKVEVNFANANMMEGEEAMAVAVPLNFRTMPNNLSFSFCLTRGDNGKTVNYNNVLAGGKLAEPLSPSLGLGDGACCGALTRSVETDVDKDGMDDGWERLNFLGKEIEGVEVTEKNYLDLVKPDDDLDHDGFLNNKFKNAKGEYVTIVPALVDHMGKVHVSGADGELTNLEEFILGTNPMIGDTNADGVGDEMNYQGIGILEFSFPVEVPPGPSGYYVVTATVLGMTNSEIVVGIASNSNKLIVSDGGKIELQLDPNPEVLTLSDDGTMQIETNVVGGEVDKKNLYYKWDFNGQSICDNEVYKEFCDVGQRILELGGSGDRSLLKLPGIAEGNLGVGDQYSFGVHIIDPSSRRDASATVSLPIAQGLTLTTACKEGAKERESVPADSKEPVEICVAELIKTSSANLLGANFQWFKDGQADLANSGLGKSTYNMLVTNPIGDKHDVILKVKDASDGVVLGGASINLVVEGPRIEIVEPFSEQVGPGYGPKERFAKAAPNTNVQFVSDAVNFPIDSSMDYSWSVNGEVFQRGEDETFNFVIPAEATEDDTYRISVFIRGISEEGDVKEASDSLSILVAGSSVAAGPDEFIKKGLATISNYVPEKFRMVLKLFTAIVAFGVFFYFITRVIKPIQAR
ncbi:MAG: hypothetical protein ACD_63C00262G0006 [uncultured bacterium]|nr:MAG: hypothetical protein ACD_63C00262G0006 [uncultured bacterium]